MPDYFNKLCYSFVNNMFSWLAPVDLLLGNKSTCNGRQRQIENICTCFCGYEFVCNISKIFLECWNTGSVVVSESIWMMGIEFSIVPTSFSYCPSLWACSYTCSSFPTVKLFAFVHKCIVTLVHDQHPNVWLGPRWYIWVYLCIFMYIYICIYMFFFLTGKH